MKRIAIMCLCLLLIAAMAVPALAAENASFSAEASETTLYRGDTVTLTVSVNCEELATSGGLMLSYDEAVFEVVDGTCTVSNTSFSSFNDGFAYLFKEPTAYSGQVGTVTLKVKDSAAFGATTITGEASIKNRDEVITASGCTVSLNIACKHNYGAWTESNDGHVQICAICQNVKTAEHTWNQGAVVKEATCTEEGQIKYTCTACNAEKAESIAMIDHVFGDWENADAENHKQICAGCQKEELQAHTFADVLTVGENSHWFACACGAKQAEAEHIFAEAWEMNESAHWHICECGAKAEEAQHDWDEGKVITEPSTTQTGVKSFTCKTCLASKTEKIPQTETPATSDMGMVMPLVLLVMLSACGVIVSAVAVKKFYH